MTRTKDDMDDLLRRSFREKWHDKYDPMNRRLSDAEKMDPLIVGNTKPHIGVWR